MPRHVLQPLPRAFAGHRDPAARRRAMMGDETWGRMDRVQVLGNGSEGHRGCVNALSWSDDGSTLLSGSDDKRICIWTADLSSSSTSPHPLRLMDTIATGHRANIFSARFLPNAGTPTIVSCAGDRDVRVFEVERLGRAELGLGNSQQELYGVEGPGVRVLKCHTDRTKRIATENSPYLFLTVSEDGTVRQHDLRRPHRCRSECPEALFHAPKGVDLYSLSVSTVTPHIFAVAGRTDCAFICDRRMPERQTPSWGPHTRSSGNVHCVRRLGLPDEEWEGVSALSQRRVFSGERHITCVKMSPDKADEVICAFARHSTSIFSLFDSPASPSARVKSSSPISPKPKLQHSPEQFLRDPSASTHRAAMPGAAEALAEASIIDRTRPATVGGSTDAEGVGDNVDGARSHVTDEDGITSPNLGKRRLSALSTSDSTPVPLARQRTSEQGSERNDGPPSSNRIGPPTPPRRSLVEDLLAELLESREENGDEDVAMGVGDALVPPVGDEDAELGLADLRRSLDSESPPRSRIGDMPPIVIYEDAPSIGSSAQVDDGDDKRELRVEPQVQHSASSSARAPRSAFPPGPHFDPEDPAVQERAFQALIDLEASDDEGDHDRQDGLHAHDFDDDMDMDEDDEDEDEVDEDEFGDPLDLEDPDAEFDGMDPRSAQSEFGGVEMIIPRRSFKGARNIETVKDCNFVGVRSDKVCSGSDDGNFFVWDKETGRLEGIWDGDGSVVNVMEQHPTLPIVAVSGIDNTVKIFAPVAQPPDPSFNRTQSAETIIKTNTERPMFHTGSAFGRVSLLQFLASRGLVARIEDEDGEGEEGLQQCATQ